MGSGVLSVRFDVITIMPEMFEAISQYGVTSRGLEQGQIELHCWNPRRHTADRHQSVDDRPYGGGPGMVMKPEPLRASIDEVRRAAPEGSKVVYLSPQGRRFDQDAARDMAGLPGLILLAGRYEGVDERLIQSAVDEEWSIGDYVLSGGELGAMVMIDAIARLVPGVLGHEDSARQDSFMEGLLDCPHFTRPEVFEGEAVPSVLLSGNHAEIVRWRRQQALGRTQQRRPDLLQKCELSDEDHLLLDEYRQNSQGDKQ
ncbi:MAG: tRNA (guanosine(37)-N1)-methyltransferase TrmD [Pseudomonadota bacterium]